GRVLRLGDGAAALGPTGPHVVGVAATRGEAGRAELAHGAGGRRLRVLEPDLRVPRRPHGDPRGVVERGRRDGGGRAVVIGAPAGLLTHGRSSPELRSLLYSARATP